MRGNETRAHIKQQSLQLFAERGVDNVSVRDILGASDQKNGASLHYHFGGREGLIKELVADGARLIDDLRNRRVDELEARDRVPTLREVLKALADPIEPHEDPDGLSTSYISFMTSLQTEHYDMFLEGVEGFDQGFRRCVEHIRAALPDIPAELLNQRIRLAMLYLFTAFSVRARAPKNSTWERFWRQPTSIDNVIDTLEGMLRQPPSKATRDALAPPDRKKTRAAGRASRARKSA